METATEPRKFGTRYPWGEWFDLRSDGRAHVGYTFTLYRGTHYHHLTYTMAQVVRRAAEQLRIPVEVTTNGHDREGIKVTVLRRWRHRLRTPGRRHPRAKVYE